MAGKTYIKTGTNSWARIKKVYLKTGGITWSPVRKVYIKTGASTWRKVYDTASNRPFIAGNDIPKIRLNTFRPNSTTDFTGTANDPVNPVVEAPPVQQMGPPITTPTVGWPSGTVGNHLWGYDGTWTSGNGSAITFIYQWLYNLTGDSNDNRFDPQFWISDTSSSRNTSSTGRADMLTNGTAYLGYSDGDYFDKNFLTFRVGATNSAGGPVYSESNPVYIVRQRPTGSINLINTTVDVPETLSATITYQDEWYRKPDLYDSYVEWFAVDSASDALTPSNRVAIQDLYTVSVTGTTTKTGTVTHNATLPNKFYSVRITLNNSNTQAAVKVIPGFTPNTPFTQEDSTAPGSALSVTTLNILDYNNNQGTDNRLYIPVGGLFKIQSNVTGVDGSTTYRIRYRMYNWQNSSYYGMDGTNYGTAASSAWTTRTGSNTSFGFGGTLINQISVSGTTATLLHNEVISSSLFGSTTFTGGQDRWQIEIEVSALKNSVRKYYADVVGGIPYYVSRPATLLLTASPAAAQVNEVVTLSGTITALGGGLSYPRQYKVNFGDGTDSGWLPSGGYSFGTSNPTFQITKQYSATGNYSPILTTIPDYSTTSTSVTVSPALTAPTSTSIVSMARLNDTTVRAVIGSSGGGGPYYQLYWQSGATAPTTTNYDAASLTSSVTEDFSFSSGITYYFYIRSSSQNLGNTIVGGTATAGTYSAYGPTTGAASYTFAQPTGSVSVSPTSGTAGTTTFTATPSVAAAPSANISYQWKYNDGSVLWLAAPNSITSPFNSTSSTYTPPANFVSLYGSSLRCDIVANNGVGTQLVTNSVARTVSAPVLIKTTGSKKIIPLGITVTSGATFVYVSTNGFIGLNADPGSAISIPSAGTYLNLFPTDLRQTALFTKATGSTYAIRYQGHLLGDTTKTVDYEILFTFGLATAQIFVITNNLGLIALSDTVLTINGVAQNTWSGASASTMTATADTALTTNNGVDDNRTAILLSAAAAPANTSQPTLSSSNATLAVGSTFTFGVGSWSGSPTSYDLRLYRGTAGVITSETLVKAAGNVTSSTYVIPQSDFDDTNNRKYYRAFASATNSTGTSGSPAGTLTPGQEIGPITSSVAATAPGTPTTPTNGWTGGLSYPFSWTAPSAGTVSGGGAATITGYSIRIYRATSSTGTGSTLWETIFSTGTSKTYNAPDTQYYACSVAATNSASLTGNYSTISAYK